MILTKSDVMKGINMISPYRYCVLSEHHLLKPVHDTNYLILFQVLFKALIPIYTVISINKVLGDILSIFAVSVAV